MSRTFIGQDPFVYEVIRWFTQMPSGERFGSVSHVACDSRDHIYVFQRGDPPLLVFDANGRLTDKLGEGLDVDAHGLFVDSRDRVFVVNRGDHCVLQLEPSGALRVVLGEEGVPRFNAPFCNPADVALAQDGTFFVADGYGNFNVHSFDSNGVFLRTWGGPGDEPGQFKAPHGVWVDRNDRVLVADRENGRVQLFDREGSYLDEWRWFFRPTDIFVDHTGHVFVTDLVPSISVISPDGRLLARGKPVDEFAHSVWGNSRGDLFVAHRRANEIVKLARVRP